MRRVAFLMLPLTLSACAGVSGYPAQPDSLPTTITSLDSKTLATRIADYNDKNTPTDQKMSIRNEIIWSDITQIDQKFNDFKLSLNSQENKLSIGSDFVSLALAGLGATVGNTATKAALAAASAGVIGAKAAIDKDVLYQKTITALVTQMEAGRSKQLAVIITNMKSDTTAYPLEAASKDLQDYYQAGTLVNAIAGVSSSASVAAQDGTNAVAKAIALPTVTAEEKPASDAALVVQQKMALLSPNQKLVMAHAMLSLWNQLAIRPELAGLRASPAWQKWQSDPGQAGQLMFNWLEAYTGSLATWTAALATANQSPK